MRFTTASIEIRQSNGRLNPIPLITVRQPKQIPDEITTEKDRISNPLQKQITVQIKYIYTRI